MTGDILVVPPFAALREKIESVLDERFSKQKKRFRILEADLSEAKIHVLRDQKLHPAKVIVSRGGTAKVLEGLNLAPVVKIQVSTMDVLETVVQNREAGEAAHIAIAGYDNVIYGTKEIAKLLKVNVTELVVGSEEETFQRLENIRRQGIDFLAGDTVSIRVAKKLGIPARIIESSKQAIYQALSEAVLIADTVARDEAKSQMVSAIVENSRDAVLVLDASYKITLFNSQAEQVFRRIAFDVLGKKADILGTVLQEAAIEEACQEPRILSIRQQDMVLSATRLEEAGLIVCTLRAVTDVQRLESTIRKNLSKKGLVAKFHMEDICGQSEAAQRMKRKAERYALTDSTILVTGASGTGKEMLVQSIHNRSERRSGPFVAVNCAALPENLLESELFGYVEGAFTGAHRGGKKGLFELAHGGTIFLDEIGELPLALQPRLLRVLQEHEVRKVGGESVLPIDVRVIAATNQNLAKQVQEGNFREDLYYRLNILRIHMPTLSERAEDIPLLVHSLLLSLGKARMEAPVITDEAVALLQKYPWPGNIRQLSNMVERLLLLSNGGRIDAKDVREALADEEGAEPAVAKPRETRHLGENRTLREEEEAQMYRVLEEEAGNITRAAKRLGIHRSTLYRKLYKK